MAEVAATKVVRARLNRQPAGVVLRYRKLDDRTSGVPNLRNSQGEESTGDLGNRRARGGEKHRQPPRVIRIPSAIEF
jgi:hypothetical protein